MHINNQKLSFDIYGMKYLNDFCHKRKIYNFDPYNVFFCTNIAVLLMTAFVLQGYK